MSALARAALLAAGLAALPQGGAPSAPEPILRLESAHEQMALARRLRRELYEAEEALRPERLQRAVEAYRAVRSHFSKDAEAVAEASFRAGELLRAGGRTGEALVEFQLARRHGGGGAFGPRGSLEIGHVHRREGRAREALESYAELFSTPGTPPRARDAAWLWSGRVHRDQGRAEEAQLAWRQVAEHGHDARLRIQAFDELALLAFEGGRREDTERILAHCRRVFHEVSLERTERGAAARRALAAMRCIRALEEAAEPTEQSRVMRSAEDARARAGARSRFRLRLGAVAVRCWGLTSAAIYPIEAAVLWSARTAGSFPRSNGLARAPFAPARTCGIFPRPRHQRAARLRNEGSCPLSFLGLPLARRPTPCVLGKARAAAAARPRTHGSRS